ncbi:hypothetical protein [Ligilactobacillus agilis]
MRNDVLERMKHYVMENIKPNYAAVGRQLNVDPRTVKSTYQKVLIGDDIKCKKRHRKSKLDGYKEIIEEKYTQNCTARAIFDFIKERGFEGKYTIVKDYCRQFKQVQIKKATIRVEHTIGLSAQVDWKERVTMYDRNGHPWTFSIFLYVLPYSKMKYLELTLDQKQDTLFKCLYHAFKYTGGIPNENLVR